MSRIVMILFVLNLFSAFSSNVNHSADVRPQECADFPSGCTCKTRNVSAGTTPEGETRYDTVVVSVKCDGIGLIEIPEFSNHTSVQTM